MRSQGVYINGPEVLKQSYQPHSIFIAHPFFGSDSLRRADYRLPFESALTDHGYQPLFPDEVANPGMLLFTLCRHIFDANASIFDITDYNANVLIELGLALGLNRPLLVIAKETGEEALPGFLEELAPLRYGNSARLAKTIVAALEQRRRAHVDGAISPQYCTACQQECASKVSLLPPGDDYLLVGVDEHQDEQMHWDIEDTLKRLELSPMHDVGATGGATVCRWMHALRQSKIALFRLKEPVNAREHAAVHVQLGLAVGLGVPWKMILAENTKPPVDLQGVHHVTAGSVEMLFRNALSNAVKGLLLKTWDSTGHIYDPLPLPDLPEEEEQPKLVDESPQQTADDVALRDALAIPEDRWPQFTESTRLALQSSQQEAQRFNQDFIGTEHLLLGLIRHLEYETETIEVAAKVLANLGIELGKVRSAVEWVIGRGDRSTLAEGVLPRAKKAVELAIDESRRFDHDYVGLEHLLLGLVREGEGIAAGVLESLGVNLEKLRRETLRVLAATRQSSASESSGAWDGDKFEKFTERSRKVLSLAHEEALRFNHNYIGTEHLLLGMLREGDGVAAKVLTNLGIELGKVRDAVEWVIGRGDRIVLGEIALSTRAKKVIELAVDEARRLNHHYIGTEHLLLAIAREGDGIAVGILESMGVSMEKVRTSILEALQETDPPQAEDTSSPLDSPDIGVREWTEQQVAWKGGKDGAFTELATGALRLAEEEAKRFNHNYIGTEHLLLGLTRAPGATSAVVLSSCGVELRKLRSAVEFIIGRGDRIVLGEIGLTPRAKKVIELARDESRRLNHHYVGTEHLLLGLVREGEGIAAGVLEALGVNLERVRAATIRLLATRSPAVGPQSPAP